MAFFPSNLEKRALRLIILFPAITGYLEFNAYVKIKKVKTEQNLK